MSAVIPKQIQPRRFLTVAMWIVVGVAIPELLVRIPAFDLKCHLRVLAGTWEELVAASLVLLALYVQSRKVVADGHAHPIMTDHEFELLHGRFLSCARNAGYTGVAASLVGVATSFAQLWEHNQGPATFVPPAVFIAPAVVCLTVSSLVSLGVQALIESQWSSARAAWTVVPRVVPAPTPSPTATNLAT